jgi:membrane protease subunit HflK
MAWNEPGPGRDPWNSPSGGNRGGDKPSELEVLIKRLRGWLGGGSPGGAPKAVQQNILLLSALVALVGWLGSGVYSIDEQERGVVLRFGAYAGTTEAGLRWHLPWPIERVERVPVTRVRSANSRATLLTQDENLVDIGLTMQYRVSSAEDYLFSVADPDNSLQPMLASTLREVIGSRPLDAVLHDGRQAIADGVKHRLQDRLNRENSGLLITEVAIQDVKLPDAVKAAFDDVAKAREDQQRVQNDAEAYADDRLPGARAEAARQLAEAQAYRAKNIARAEGDAARFNAVLGEYRQAPEITRQRLYIDAMSDVMNQSGKVLVDIDKGNPTINIPLEQLMKAGPANPPATGDSGSGTTAAAPSRPGTAPAPNSNDGYRSRDRESH